MSANQKIIISKVIFESQAEELTERLNIEAGEGWRVQHCSTKVYKDAKQFKADAHFVLLEKSEFRFHYLCIALATGSNPHSSRISSVLDEQSANGYRLISILHTYGFVGNEDRTPITKETTVLIFEKEV